MREAVLRLADGLTDGPSLPPLLDAVLERLQSSSWPEVVATWSRLTPSGFPVELTIGPTRSPLRWTAEVAGPEVSECERLPLVAMLLADNGQPMQHALLEALIATQEGADLRWGAWIGGREEPDSAGRLKLYAELPAGVELAALLVPEPVREVLNRLPSGAEPRMLGVEPDRKRTEIYLGLPAIDALDLLPFLYVTGHASALGALERGLPDGLRRLTGRRLGLSVAFGTDNALELALFTSARTLFAVEPAQLVQLAPHFARLNSNRGRPGPVTIVLDPSGRCLPVAVGWSSAARRRSRRGGAPDRDPTWRPPVRRDRGVSCA